MKRTQLLTYIGASLVVLAFVVVGVLTITKSSTSSADARCKGVVGESHQVMIMNDKVSPRQTTAKLCDTLTITNHDNVSREMAFGNHEKHVAYDGVSERVLGQGKSVSITLVSPGNYHFHDHEHDEVEGFFTVTE